jgi:hypothetical protein
VGEDFGSRDCEAKVKQYRLKSETSSCLPVSVPGLPDDIPSFRRLPQVKAYWIHSAKSPLMYSANGTGVFEILGKVLRQKLWSQRALLIRFSVARRPLFLVAIDTRPDKTIQTSPPPRISRHLYIARDLASCLLVKKSPRILLICPPLLGRMRIRSTEASTSRKFSRIRKYNAHTRPAHRVASWQTQNTLRMTSPS